MLSDLETTSFKLKNTNADFQVFECYAQDQVPIHEGEFQYCSLFKSGFSTFEVIDELAKSLELKLNQLTYHGLKDEEAYTQQLISIQINESILFKRINEINCKNNRWKDKFFRLTHLYSSSKPLTIGSLLGNSFLIKLRDLSFNTANCIKKSGKYINCQIINYYGNQRFGLPGQKPTTHIIGKYLLEEKFDKALEILSEQNSTLGAAAIKFNGSPEIFFSSLDLRKRNFFINSYFSYNWNQEIFELIKKNNIASYNYNDCGFPLLFTLQKNRLIELLQNKKIIMNKLVPDRSSTTPFKNEREIILNVKFNIHDINEDKQFYGKYSADISFFLPSGCYATIAVPQFLLNVLKYD